MDQLRHQYIRDLYRDLTAVGEEANKRVISLSRFGSQAAVAGELKEAIQAAPDENEAKSRVWPIVFTLIGLLLVVLGLSLSSSHSGWAAALTSLGLVLLLAAMSFLPKSKDAVSGAAAQVIQATSARANNAPKVTGTSSTRPAGSSSFSRTTASAIGVSGERNVAISFTFVLGAMTTFVMTGLLFDKMKWIWWGSHPFDTGFVVANLIVLAAGAMVMIRRRRVLTGSEGALYWLVCSLISLIGVAAVFNAMKWHWWGYSAASTGLSVGSILVLVLNAFLVVHRGKVVSGPELALYWFGCSVGIFCATVELFTSMRWQWWGSNSTSVGVVVAGALVLLSALALGFLRGPARLGADLAIYWLGSAVAVMAALASLFTSLKLERWGLTAANTGLVLAAFAVIASGVVLAILRWRSLVGIELSLYWLGSSTAAIVAAPLFLTALDWRWGELKPFEAGMSVGGLITMGSCVILLLLRWRTLQSEELALYWLGWLVSVWFGVGFLLGAVAASSGFLAVLVGGPILMWKISKPVV